MKTQTILALGADIKNRFLIATGGNLRFGPDIGDLSDAENYEAFKKEVQRATEKIKPDIIACDLHPGYFSTGFAKDYNPLRIQHHHAHIASVVEEHGLEGGVIGVCFDGTGFGTDRNIWGGEFLLVDKKGFKRLAHLKYARMPGGDKVVGEPWRMALGVTGPSAVPFLKSVKKKEKEAVLEAMSKNINSPLTSSAGRLFDACSALLGICEYTSYEAEGPIKLEAICEEGIGKVYDFDMLKEGDGYVIDTEPMFSEIIGDLKKKIKKEAIATKFHNAIADIIIKTVKKLSKATRTKDVALSGGVFQNKFLRTKTVRKLSSKFNVFINDKTPVNDFNISLGQYHVSRRTGKG